MKFQVQNKQATPKKFVNYTLCKLLEDYDKNFIEYAKVMCPSETKTLTENDIARLNNWCHKLVIRVNKLLKKDAYET